MDSDGFHTSAEAGAARELMRQAALLCEGEGKLPRGFVAALFGRAAAEDLVVYSAEELAAVAKAAFDHLQQRAAGEASIRISHPPQLAGAKTLAAVSVVEIGNDDMPFLLDSVLGELAAHGAAVRLVAHPIFTVERGKNGKLLAWKGEAPARTKEHRESFIHVHIDRLDE